MGPAAAVPHLREGTLTVNIGLPGTGLAGLFYLLAALWMPCHELVRTLRGQGDAARRHRARTQAGLALGIIATIAATGWMLGLLLSARAVSAAAVPGAHDGEAIHLLGVAPTVLAFATLAAVVLLLEVIGLALARRRPRARARS